MFCCMPVMSRSEDYLKTIYALVSRDEPVTTSGLALELGVSSPSVSAMAKRLQTEQLLQRPGGGWVLTERGERAALRVIRRHRMVETFLARALGMGWDEVHAEAELLEHVLSDRLEERIDAALGHPTHDPHGDPIPPRHGQHTEAVGQPLDTPPPGCRFRVERVSDRDSAALRYLSTLGIAPGVVVDVEEQEPFGGPRWVRIDGARHALGAPLSRILRGHVVTSADEEPPEGGCQPARARTAPTDIGVGRR